VTPVVQSSSGVGPSVVSSGSSVILNVQEPSSELVVINAARAAGSPERERTANARHRILSPFELPEKRAKISIWADLDFCRTSQQVQSIPSIGGDGSSAQQVYSRAGTWKSCLLGGAFGLPSYFHVAPGYSMTLLIPAEGLPTGIRWAVGVRRSFVVGISALRARRRFDSLSRCAISSYG